MIECEEEQENQDNENIQKNKKERKAAEDLRLKAMESLADSKARKRASFGDVNESSKNSKKRRSSGTDVLQYLREKAENERELNRQELEFQIQEMTMGHLRFQQTQQQSQQMMAIMLQLLKNKK